MTNRCFFMPKAVQRRAAQGQALMEYAVPACIILFSAGLWLTLTDTNATVAEYFMAASGHTKANLSGGVFKTAGLAETAYGSMNNGDENFPIATLTSVVDGNNQPANTRAAGLMYKSAVSRSGGRSTLTSANETLYPDSP